MPRKKKGPMIPGFPDKWAKKLPETFPDDVNSMDLEEMKKVMVTCEKVIDETEKDMEEDPKLAMAKEDVKVLGGAYKDTINACKAKVKYLVHVMKERGYA